MKKNCKICKDLLNENNKFGYWQLGYCSIACMILDLDIRLAKLESATDRLIADINKIKSSPS